LQPAFKVERVTATECPQQLVYIALHNDYSEDFCSSTTLTEDRCGQIAVERLLKGNRGHYGPLEGPQLTLALQADHNTIMQLRTHRVGVSFDVQSMRYTGGRIERVANGDLPVEDVFYVRPPGKYRDRQGDPYEWTADDVEEFYAMALSSAIDYTRLRERGVAEEHARGVLITSYFQNAIVSANLRAWFHLLDVRLKGDAQHEIRCLMELIAGQVQRWVPEIYSWYTENRRGKAFLAP
jgi:thymidylate synthase (FAD)